MTVAPTPSPEAEVAAWAASGAMALTGWPDAPLGPPAGLVPKVAAIARVLADRARSLDGSIEVDALALLGERAAVAGLERRGTTSCGGATRLLPTGDGRWLAVALARPEDVELVPAWLELDGAPSDPWTTVAAVVARRSVAELEARGVLLGLPLGVLPEGSPPRPESDLPLVASSATGPVPARRPLAEVRVLDLTSLWAGPLCGSLLAGAGADVVKVESSARPDGARSGPTPFFDLLNGGKRSVALDLRSASGVAQLRALLATADVVLEASRPRALEQLGIEADDVLANGRTHVWASITGHGRRGPGRARVAFGDDAAVAGGLVSGPVDEPVFCADAVADPMAGLIAAAGVLDALVDGGRWMLEVPMVGVAAHLAGPALPAPDDVTPMPPRARAAVAPAPALGADTVALLAAAGQ